MTEEECEALLNEPLSKASMKSKAPKLRMGKHNMAKGALPPEELAVGACSLEMFFIDNSTCLLGDETSRSTSKEYAKTVINLQDCNSPQMRYKILSSSNAPVTNLRCILWWIKCPAFDGEDMQGSQNIAAGETKFARCSSPSHQDSEEILKSELNAERLSSDPATDKLGPIFSAISQPDRDTKIQPTLS